MYYHIKYCFLVLVLSVVCEFQCSGNDLNDDKETYNQRNMLIEQLQNALMNDREQVFTLQKAFLFPREKDLGGLYLKVNITVEGTVTDFYDYDYEFLNHCMSYFPQNKSCIFDISKCFELSPAADSMTMTLVDVLQVRITVLSLMALDPSFYYLTNTLSLNNDYDDDDDDYNDCGGNEYTIHLMIDEIQLKVNNLAQVDNHVTDALYVTLSWVSCIMIMIN